MLTCAHCGSDTRASVSSGPVAAGQSRLARGTGTQRTLHDASHAARLAAVARHDDYPAALAFGPPRPSALDRCLPLVMIVAGTLAVGRTMSVTGGGVAAVLAGLLAAPWFLVAVMLGRDVWGRRSVALRPRIARVISADGLTSGGVATVGSVELQLESGARRRLSCHPGLSAALVPDDVGVAYELQGRLVAFRRFDV